jgi:hypothetical protein
MVNAVMPGALSDTQRRPHLNGSTIHCTLLTGFRIGAGSGKSCRRLPPTRTEAQHDQGAATVTRDRLQPVAVARMVWKCGVGVRERMGGAMGVVNMKRVIAVAACGLTLTACSSWMPSFDMSMPSFGGGGSATASLAIESDPPGAQASTQGGASCVTPCRLNVEANAPFAVNVALNGYIPQSVPVRVVQPDDPRLGSDGGGGYGPRLDPNPLYVELERAPPPSPPPRKLKPRPKRPTVAKHRAPPAATVQAPPAAAPSAPTTAVAPPAQPAPPPMQPAQQPANSAAPWPMPR